MRFLRCGLIAAILLPLGALADTVKITPEIPFIEINIDNKSIYIERIQDESNRLTGYFARTSRACPPFCIRPMEVAPGVVTIGELEVLTFLENDVTLGTGVLIDNRIPRIYQSGTIPGAINIPFNVLAPGENEYLGAILSALGANQQGEKWEFSNAKSLVLFCNGLWCGQSPLAINNLISVGYPTNRLFYYRGGMESWLSVGLTTIVPQTP